jgi:protein-disulfide isomerase
MEQQENNQIDQKIETKKPMSISTSAAIVTAGVVIALALILSGKGSSVVKNNNAVENQQQVETVPPGDVSVKPTDHVRGDLTKAEVTIVEYSDSDCPYCQRFHTTMQEVIKKYG